MQFELQTSKLTNCIQAMHLSNHSTHSDTQIQTYTTYIMQQKHDKETTTWKKHIYEKEHQHFDSLSLSRSLSLYLPHSHYFIILTIHMILYLSFFGTKTHTVPHVSRATHLVFFTRVPTMVGISSASPLSI